MGPEQLSLFLCGLMAVFHVRMMSACRRCYHTSNLSERELFHQAEFAMQVHVWRLISSNRRGETAYQITVRGQPFKVKSVRQYQDRVYTPTGRRCGVTLDPGHDYLITGNYRIAKDGVHELYIDACGWVDEWSSLEAEQMHWLRLQRFSPTPVATAGGQRSVVDPSMSMQSPAGLHIQNQGAVHPYSQGQGSVGRIGQYVQHQTPVGRIDQYTQSQAPVGRTGLSQRPLDTFGQSHTPVGTVGRIHAPAGQPQRYVDTVRQDQFIIVPAAQYQSAYDPYGQRPQRSFSF